VKIENGVCIGRAGYFFLVDGAHNVLEYISGAKKISPEKVDIFKSNIKSRLDFFANKKIKYLHVISPDKQSVLTKYFPSSNSLVVGKIFTEDSCQNHILFPLDDLRALSKKYQVFQRADSHQTSIGDILVASLVLRALLNINVDQIVDDYLKNPPLMLRRAGDLGSKLNPMHYSEEPFYHDPPNSKCTWYTNSVALNGANNGIIDIRFNSEPIIQGRVLMIGDSFGRGIAKYLQLFFSEILFFRSQKMHYELVEDFSPDFVITQNVERYLPSSILDDNLSRFFDYPSLISASYQPSEKFKEALLGVTRG